MRRNCLIALALAVGVAACAAAQTSSPQAAKTHHPKVHHPRTHHPAPPANPEAKDHQSAMKQEAASRKRESLPTTEGKPALKSEKSASSSQRAESAREARAHRRSRVKPHSTKKHHATSSSTVGENRLERGRRESAESRPGYEDGFRAGFAAGLAAHRGEAESASRPSPAPRFGSRAPSSQSSEAAPEPVPESDPEPATEAHFSDATVRSTSPLSGVAAAASNVPAPAMERSHSRPEDASLESIAGTHIVPISLTASMHLLHEPAVAPLRGTLASLERQNQRLDAEGLQRVEDESDLEYRVARKLLVPLPISDRLAVNPGLPVERRYCRPWTAEFLTDMARMHEAVFHQPLRVDSAVRTVDYQRHLISFNANAAPAEGDVASPHETGATVDIAKRGMTWREIGWMRRYLKSLENAGLIDVEEEFHQSCFHITVYDAYGRRGLVPHPGTDNDGGSDHNSEASVEAGGTGGQ